MKIQTVFILCAIILYPFLSYADDNARKIIERSEQQTMGDSLQARIKMEVVRDGSPRTLEFKLWQSKRDKAFIKIQAPAKDRGTASLRIDLNMWQYLPNVAKVIRIPPSMMLQSWMGSDFTNDDLIKTSSLSRDYTHTLDGEETLRGDKVTKILCIPKPNAPVVWGKVRVWVRTADAVTVRQEFFSEKDELIKQMDGTEIKKFGSHTVPSVLTMTVVKKPGNKTIMNFIEANFDKPIDSKIFTQSNLTRTGD